MNNLLVMLLSTFCSVCWAGLFSSNPFESIIFKAKNDEWCSKAEKAKSNLVLGDSPSGKEPDGREIASMSWAFRKYHDLKTEEAKDDKLEYLLWSQSVFCSKAFFESLDNTIDKEIFSTSSKELKFSYYVMEPNFSLSSPDRFREENNVLSLNLSEDEKNSFYYISTGKYGDKDFAVYKVPEIKRIKNAIEYFLNYQTQGFYSEASIDKVYVKKLELKYPSFSGKTIEDAKKEKKEILKKYLHNVVFTMSNDVFRNQKLFDIANHNVPVGLTKNEGESVSKRYNEFLDKLFPSDGTEIVSSKVSLELDPFYEHAKYTTTELDFSPLTDFSPDLRLKVFGEFLIANSIIEFNRKDENTVEFEIKIDIPKAISEYSKKKMSDLIVK